MSSNLYSSDSDNATAFLPKNKRNVGYVSAQEVIDAIGNSNQLMYHLLILGLCNSADAIEITAFGYIMNLIKLQDGSLASEDEFWGGALSSAVFIGMLVGGLLCGFWSDKLGRQSMLLYCMLLNFFGAICSSLTLFLPYQFQLVWLLIARLLAGFGVGGTIPSVFALGAEVTPTSLKSQAINVIASFWMVGLTYTSVSAYFLLSGDVAHVREEGSVEHWPLFALIAGIPAGSAALLVKLFIQKSPIFLERKGEKEAVGRILSSYLESRSEEGSFNILSCFPEDIRLERSSPRIHSSEIRELIGRFLASEGEVQEMACQRVSLSTSMQQLMGGEYKWVVVRLFIVWFTLSFASYGLLSWIATLFSNVGFDDNPYIPSLYFAASSFPGNVFAVWLSPKMRSESLLAGSLFLSCISLLFALDINSRFRILLGSSGFQCFSSTAWNALGALSTKSFPSKIRALAYGTLSCGGRIGGITAGVVNGLLFSTSKSGEGGFLVLGFNAVIIGIGCGTILWNTAVDRY